jgi:hypothetical protein
MIHAAFGAYCGARCRRGAAFGRTRVRICVALHIFEEALASLMADEASTHTEEAPRARSFWALRQALD